MKAVRKCVTAILLAGLVMLAGSTIHAAWSNDPAVNLPVTDSPQRQYAHHLCNTPDGGYVVVWTTVDPVKALGKEEGDGIFVQEFNGDGDRVWGDEGVQVCFDTMSGCGPRVCSDGTGGAFVAWQDYRGGHTTVYGQRVSSTGVPQWASGGILISQNGYIASNPSLVADGGEGAFVGWRYYE
ncbi:hypothetical protein JW905_07505, partial [bacterium]|nr:hypothetical protein [candidate division CSSED10-310 bacterium]